MNNDEKQKQHINDEPNTENSHQFQNFKALDSLDIDQIVKLLEGESLQLKTLVLTFLPTQRSRIIINRMKEEEKQEILKRISEIRVVNLDVVSHIERMLEEDINNRIKKLITVNGKSLSQGLKERLDEASTGRVNEKEKKYLIESLSMYHTLLSSNHIMGYTIENKNKKERNYIYFDTKDLQLYNNDISYSVRDRGKDYFITLKIPVAKGIIEREEYNASLPKKDNVFDIDIHKNNSQLVPVRMANNIVKNKKMMISARFTVITTRGLIYLDREHFIEVSFDKIKAKKNKNGKIIELYEIEIENKTAEDFVFFNFCENFRKSIGLEELNYSKYHRVMNELHNTDKIK